MKDDNKNEYQYPEGEYIVDGESHPAEEPQHAALPQPGANMLLEIWRANKRVIIITAIAIFVALLFKIFSGHKAEQAPVAVEPVQVQSGTDNSTMVNQVSNQMQDAVNAASQNKAAIDELHNEVEQLKASIDSINSSQAQFSNTLGMLSDQINQIQVSLQPKKPVAVKKQATVAPIVYYLRAIIPGRAWIQGTDSSARSVAVGDMVKQYGVVQSIDAENGVVTTSSGKTIGFNSDDS